MSPPTTAPTAVPANRCADMGNDAPTVDCMMTRVDIEDQYASGNRNSRAINTEATAATAVRIAWTVEDGFSLVRISPAECAVSVRVFVAILPTLVIVLLKRLRASIQHASNAHRGAQPDPPSHLRRSRFQDGSSQSTGSLLSLLVRDHLPFYPAAV